MASLANPKSLWLVRSFIVAVDDAAPTRRIFPYGQTIDLSFQHEGRTVCGTVTREQSLVRGAIKYSIAIEDELIDEGMIQTGNMPVGWLTFAGAFVLAVGGPYAIAALNAPWYAILICILGSLTCSLATIRLMAGDLACLLPARSRNNNPSSSSAVYERNRNT